MDRLWELGIAIGGSIGAALLLGFAAWLRASYGQFVGFRQELAGLRDDIRRLLRRRARDRRAINANTERIDDHEQRIGTLEGRDACH